MRSSCDVDKSAAEQFQFCLPCLLHPLPSPAGNSNASCPLLQTLQVRPLSERLRSLGGTARLAVDLLEVKVREGLGCVLVMSLLLALIVRRAWPWTC